MLTPKQALGPTGACSIMVLLDDKQPLLSNGQWAVEGGLAATLAPQVLSIWKAALLEQVHAGKVRLRDLEESELSKHLDSLYTGNCIYGGGDIYLANFAPDDVQREKARGILQTMDSGILIRRNLCICTGAVLDRKGKAQAYGWPLPFPSTERIWLWAPYLAMAFEFGGSVLEHALGTENALIRGKGNALIMALGLYRPTDSQ